MKKQKKQDYTMLWFFLFVMTLFTLVIWASNQMEKQQEEIRPYKDYRYNYECDGKLLNDTCNYAELKKGIGVYIYDCKSGNEYVCQSTAEIKK
ncbi:MAG: hypothetical protein AABY22_03710 [Nanoarchaeota archaeon]